jgi:hypothetical protein
MSDEHFRGSRPRFVRDVLFVDADTMRVNCGRCGKEVLVRLEDVREKATVDCEQCAAASRINDSSKPPEHPAAAHRVVSGEADGRGTGD